MGMHPGQNTTITKGLALTPDKTPLEEIELLTASSAQKLTHICRNILSSAMDKYKATKGQMGLAYVTFGDSTRRFIRRASLRRWLEECEKRACYV